MTLYTDTIVGHKLIVEKKGFGKKLSLQNVVFWEFLGEIMTKMEEQGELEPERILEDVPKYIRKRIEENFAEIVSKRNCECGIIDELKYNFTDSYLRNFLRYFQGMR
jgi:hypothetical protein